MEDEHVSATAGFSHSLLSSSLDYLLPRRQHHQHGALRPSVSGEMLSLSVTVLSDDIISAQSPT